jgi:hypothetical protein
MPRIVVAAAFLSAALLAGCDSAKDSTVEAKSASTNSSAAFAKVPLDDKLRDRLDSVIEFSRERELDPATNNAWQIVHGVLAYGYDLNMNVDGESKPGLQWILDGGTFRGWAFAPGPKGLRAIMDPGTKVGQGHEDQWLGYMSQSHVDPETKITVGDKQYTVQDLIEQAKWDAPERPEATWTIMALGNYLPSDTKWTAKDGNDQWNLEHLVTHECQHELHASACGGSHQLYALAVAVNRRKREGLPIEGGWKIAEDKINYAIEAAQKNQQPDGSFSTEFFSRPATTRALDVRINTTGHTFEFLALALPKERLDEAWVVRGCNALLKMLELTKNEEVECAGLYHAVHGLRLYRARCFGESETGRPVLVGLAPALK